MTLKAVGAAGGAPTAYAGVTLEYADDPPAFVAYTANVYCVPAVSPVTGESDVAEPLLTVRVSTAPPPTGVATTTYPVAPELTVQLTEATPAVDTDAVTPVGASGGSCVVFPFDVTHVAGSEVLMNVQLLVLG